jgi:hypothetical protein
LNPASTEAMIPSMPLGSQAPIPVGYSSVMVRCSQLPAVSLCWPVHQTWGFTCSSVGIFPS